MTIKEAITQVANTLDGISLPVGLIKTAGVPISNSVDILRQCIQYMEKAEQEEQAAAKEANKEGASGGAGNGAGAETQGKDNYWEDV